MRNVIRYKLAEKLRKYIELVKFSKGDLQSVTIMKPAIGILYVYSKNLFSTLGNGIVPLSFTSKDWKISPAPPDVTTSTTSSIYIVIN